VVWPRLLRAGLDRSPGDEITKFGTSVSYWRRIGKQAIWWAGFLTRRVLTPHGFCLLWEPALIWTYALSDAVIGLAYFSIPVALIIVARRRSDFVFRPLLWLFAAFILLCGTTQGLDLLTLWVPAYGLDHLVTGRHHPGIPGLLIGMRGRLRRNRSVAHRRTVPWI
jgi:hypothetical protein